MVRANVYFDGQNFLNEARRAFGYTRADYDPLSLSKLICDRQGWELGKVFFYTGMPPAHWALHKFWASKKPAMISQGVEVFTRPLAPKKKRIQLPDGSVHEETFYVEKGIDVRIALDVTRHAAEGKYDVLVLCSLDQDFAEAITDVHNIAKEQGRKVDAYSAFPLGTQRKKPWTVKGTRPLIISKAEYDRCLDQRAYGRSPPAQLPQQGGPELEWQVPPRPSKRLRTRPWFVITGGPCSGKTTLVNELARRNFNVVPEAARTHIEANLASGLSLAEIRGDEAAFQLDLIPMKIRAERSLPPDKVTFLDRGMHDSIVYLAHAGVRSHPSLDAAVSKTYYRVAFLLDLLPFDRDGARTESVHETQMIHDALGRAYDESGIPVVRVPLISVPKRVEFVLNQLKSIGVVV